eukprot:CAMPEP_0170509236 /NCGR_PEP_ID=MMETSP0208-20121228/64867_1 /TAXON_ID=197538 /ORGANISM="Strombidium inclinatum, Strain S3" /LENGTH=82 /DNA_ID=CAMNT_0010792551 /DNA_START=8 /DNA_END=256 /DNA_ORIENTATION=+
MKAGTLANLDISAVADEGIVNYIAAITSLVIFSTANSDCEVQSCAFRYKTTADTCSNVWADSSSNLNLFTYATNLNSTANPI